MTKVIIVDDDDHVLGAYAQSLELENISTIALSRAEEALEHIGRTWSGVLVTDISMPGMDGLTLMQKVLEIDSDLPVILITAVGDVPMAVKAMRDGAYDFLEKPFAPEVLIDSVRRAQEKRTLTLENRKLREQVSAGNNLEARLVGRSAKMVKLRELITNFAPTDADVLIMGETGSGKEMVARSLHELSPRSNKRFVPINCGALPENIIESELFGHERGAFTGAVAQRIGKFEHAKGGTLFLDEIESMPLSLQVKLLRVLQDRKIERLGSNEDIPIDVRVIAATKDELRDASTKGSFREDLYYRLNVLSLSIPPLRERREDIPLLFHHFVNQASDRFKTKTPDIEPTVLSSLLSRDWPGNVRELQNEAARFVLGFNPDQPDDETHAQEKNASSWLLDEVAKFEAELINMTLSKHNGSMKETYEELGISRRTLYDKIQKHGIEPHKIK